MGWGVLDAPLSPSMTLQCFRNPDTAMTTHVPLLSVRDLTVEFATRRGKVRAGQRVVIALSLARRPQLLIADEPTTGLDVPTQKAVMDLVVELTRERGMSTILITHDLGLAAAYCARVVVMEKGTVVEAAPSRQIFAAPAHAYTRKLMKATPRLGIGLRDLLPADPSPSPPVGEGRGGGSGGFGTRVPDRTTPTPDPSPQGGGGQKMPLLTV